MANVIAFVIPWPAAVARIFPRTVFAELLRDFFCDLEHHPAKDSEIPLELVARKPIPR
jgi:hypothetical protein